MTTRSTSPSSAADPQDCRRASGSRATSTASSSSTPAIRATGRRAASTASSACRASVPPSCAARARRGARSSASTLIDAHLRDRALHDEETFELALDGGETRRVAPRCCSPSACATSGPTFPDSSASTAPTRTSAPTATATSARTRRSSSSATGRKAVGHGAQPHHVDARHHHLHQRRARRARPAGVLREARRAEHSRARVARSRCVAPQRIARALARLRERHGSSTPTRSSSPSASIPPTTSARSSAASATTEAHHRRRRVPHVGARTASPPATSCPGPQLAIAAAADGAIAALAIHKSLVPMTRKLEKLESVT